LKTLATQSRSGVLINLFSFKKSFFFKFFITFSKHILSCCFTPSESQVMFALVWRRSTCDCAGRMRLIDASARYDILEILNVGSILVGYIRTCCAIHGVLNNGVAAAAASRMICKTSTCKAQQQ
jgi:hypothetical protein